MVPNVNARGQSFMGVSAYLLYGERGAENPGRVAWSATYNMHTDDIEKAAKVMAWTDKEREFIRMENGGKAQGRKAEAGNVYHYSLSWKDGQDPTREEMEDAARESVARLKLAEHQYFFVAHNDTAHKHIHIVANLVHPGTGKIASVQRDYKTLDRFAHEYELNTEIVCAERDKKYQAWDEGKDAYAQPVQSKKDRSAAYKAHLTAAYHGADSGKAFLHALEEKGLALAWKDGKRGGYLVVDAQGDVFGLTRLIDGAKQKDVSALLKAVDIKTLRSANELAAERLQSFKDREAEKGKASRQQAEKQEAEKAAQRAAQQRQREEKAARIEKAERAAKYQKRIDEKVATSKEKWQIDALTEEVRNAREASAKYKTFWDKVFHHRAYVEAGNHLQDMEQRLAERRGRWLDDIEAYNAKRPDWAQRKEREKYGFAADGARGPQTGQDKDAQAQVNAARAKDEQIIKAAHDTPEAAARVAETVQAKTASQKANVEEIKAQARSHRETQAAEKAQEQKRKEETHAKTQGTLKQAVNDAAQGHEREDEADSVNRADAWEEWQDFFNQQQAQIANNNSLTDEQRTAAYADLQEEYYDVQTSFEHQHQEEQQTQQNQGNGLER